MGLGYLQQDSRHNAELKKSTQNGLGQGIGKSSIADFKEDG
jgi:hypothetical protein